MPCAPFARSTDVILVGELRDTETMGICLQAAETGHLVFSTLHTASAAESMERILSDVPAARKALVQQRLGKTLRGITSQQLVPTADGKGRACATEILNVSPPSRNILKKGAPGRFIRRLKKAPQWKMQTMKMALDGFYKEGKSLMRRSRIRRKRSELVQMMRLDAVDTRTV